MSSKLPIDTDSVSGMIATSTDPGTKSVSTIARIGVARRPKPSPTDACTAAPTNANPTQNSATPTDTRRLFGAAAVDERPRQRLVTENGDHVERRPTPQNHQEI